MKKTRHIGIVAAMNSPALFQPYFAGESWNGWRTILRGAYALPMSDREREFFRAIAGRDPPTRRVRELWVVAGRRAGKDSIASLIAAHAAALFSGRDRLRRGERALVACLACDREQAKIVLSYTRSYFDNIPSLRSMVTRRVTHGFELSNNVDIAVATNSFRSIRGRPILCAIFDEVSFWRDETSATPDEETYTAIKPGMATLPDAMLIGISTPYRKAGLLYRKYRENYGRDGDILVVRAPSITLNPTIDQATIDQAFAEDPVNASAEYGAEFRSDIESYISREVVEAAVDHGVFERAPIDGVRYHGYVDPSGGSSDSMTLGIAHNEKGVLILDALRERKPPFSPEVVVGEFADLLKRYRIGTVHGDRYGGEWPREQFVKLGITYRVSERTCSDLFRDTLPELNSKNVALLDSARLVAQLCSLERRTSRGGRDVIQHPQGQHDDVANAAAGALLLARKRAFFQPDVGGPPVRALDGPSFGAAWGPGGSSNPFANEGGPSPDRWSETPRLF